MKNFIFVIAPLGEGWGIWLDGFLLEEPDNEDYARRSVALRLEGVRERGDFGRFIVMKEAPAPGSPPTIPI